MISYLMRHWRGELPLPVSWWINGVALTGFLVANDVTGYLPGWPPAIESRAGFGAFFAASLVLTLVVPAWQVIGIFRAADRHAATGGRVLAGRITQSFATVLTILLAIRFLIFTGESVPGLRLAYASDYTVSVTPAGRLLEISGSFGYGLAREVRRVLAANPRVRRVRLESGGGALSEAQRVRDLIVARGLDTDSRTRCASACVSAYIGGHHRLLARAARIGLHLPRNPGFGRRGPLGDAYTGEIGYFAQHGVPLWFRQRWVLTGREFWYPPPAQLRQAGIVTAFYGRPKPGEEIYFR
jgi:hypothetical protein